MPGSYFTSGPDGLHPQPHAHGPWSEEMLHGRLLGALAARAAEAVGAAEGFVGARLTVDLFKVAPMAPVQVDAAIVRQGRRIRVADARVRCSRVRPPRALARPGAVGRQEYRRLAPGAPLPADLVRLRLSRHPRPRGTREGCARSLAAPKRLSHVASELHGFAQSKDSRCPCLPTAERIGKVKQVSEILDCDGWARAHYVR